MALDSQIEAVYGLAGGYEWAGTGFMGYALLAELTQIPEFRIPCEMIAKEMTRKWGKITSIGEASKGAEVKKAKKIKAIEAEFERLGVQEAFRWAFEKDQMFGRSQIWLDMGVTEGPELLSPLDPAIKVAKGSLKGLRLIEPLWTYPNKYNSNDPLDPNFYRPETWYVMGKEVNSTRFLSFNSRPMPDILKPAYMFGGISLIQMMWLCVDNWLRTRQSVSDIIHAFSTFVLMTDLGQAMTPGDADALAARAEMFNVGRDNLGLMIVDKTKEDFKNVSAPLSGLDKLQAQSQEHMAAVAGAPLVVLFGISPSGLNATAEPELLVFESKIAGDQERVGTPNMRKLLEVVQMSLFGSIDPDIGWTWTPLRELDEEKLANVRKVKAEVAGSNIDHGITSAEEERRVLAADEDSPYASLNVEEIPVPAESDQDDDEEDADHEPSDAPDAHLRDARLPHSEAEDSVEFKESDHPRSENGQFGPGSGGNLSETGAYGAQKNPGNTSDTPGIRATNHVSPANAATLKAYTGSSYRAINGHLRGGKTLGEADQHHIQQLDEMLGSASMPETTTVYRGLGSLAVEQLLGPERKVKAGQVLTDAGFPSTSINDGVARQFMNVNPKNIMMSVKVPKGSKAMDISKYSDDPNEKETLIARGAKFKVIKYDHKARKLEVELLPHDYEPANGKKKNGMDGAVDEAPSKDQDKFAYADASGLSISDGDENGKEFDLN